MAFKNTNPVFNKISKGDYYSDSYATASYMGVGLKILFYVGMTIIGALLGIFLLMKNPGAMIATVSITLILCFIFGMAAMMIPRASMICGTIYCILQGAFVGVASLLFEEMIPGVVIVAVMGTLAVVLGVAVLYLTGLVKVTNRFYRILMLFAIGFIFTMLICFVLQFFTAFSGLFSNIGVYLLVSSASLLLASLFLMADMEQIKRIVESGQPKQYEWMVAFGITYTVIWIYLQVLRIVAVIAARNR